MLESTQLQIVVDGIVRLVPDLVPVALSVHQECIHHEHLFQVPAVGTFHHAPVQCPHGNGLVSQHRDVGRIPGHLLHKSVFRSRQPVRRGVPQLIERIIGKFPYHESVRMDTAQAPGKQHIVRPKGVHAPAAGDFHLVPHARYCQHVHIRVFHRVQGQAACQGFQRLTGSGFHIFRCAHIHHQQHVLFRLVSHADQERPMGTELFLGHRHIGIIVRALLLFRPFWFRFPAGAAVFPQFPFQDAVQGRGTAQVLIGAVLPDGVIFLILDPGQEFGKVLFLLTGILLHGHRDETGQRVQIGADHEVLAHRKADPGRGVIDFLAASRHGEGIPTAGRFVRSIWRSVPG